MKSYRIRVLSLVIADDWSELDDASRAELYAELRASFAEADAGELVDADVVLADLRAEA